MNRHRMHLENSWLNEPALLRVTFAARQNHHFRIVLARVLDVRLDLLESGRIDHRCHPRLPDVDRTAHYQLFPVSL